MIFSSLGRPALRRSAQILVVFAMMGYLGADLDAQQNTVARGSDTTAVSDATSGRTELTFPVQIDDLAQAGAGKYLLLQSIEGGRIYNVDIGRRNFCGVGRFPQSILFSGGLHHCVVVDQDANALSRYRLPDLRRERTVILDRRPIKIAIGSASLGPIVVLYSSGDIEIRDLDTLKVQEVLQVTLGGDPRRFSLDASGDGLSFLVAESRLNLFRRTSGKWQLIKGRDVDVPLAGPDGTHFFSADGVLNDQLRADGPNGPVDGWRVPATSGPFYLHIAKPDRRSQKWIGTLRCIGSDHGFAQIDDLEVDPPRGFLGRPNRSAAPTWLPRRICFCPNENTIVELTQGNRSLRFRTIKPDDPAGLKDSNILFTRSQPPAHAIAGQEFSYSIDTVSNHPPIAYQFVQAPKTMTVSANGLVRWHVPLESTGQPISAIVECRDAAEQISYHPVEFSIVDPEVAGRLGGLAPSESGEVELPLWARRVKPESNLATQAAQTTNIPLPGVLSQVAVGGAGRYLVGSSPTTSSVVVVDLVERRVAKLIPVQGNVRCAAGMKQFVLLLTDQNAIQRWDFETLALEKSVALPHDVQIADVALGSASQGPVFLATNDPDQPYLFWDLHALSTLYFPSANNGARLTLGGQTPPKVRVSSDGTTFALWRMGTAPSGVFIIKLTGNESATAYDHRTSGYLVPNGDGTIIYSANGLYDSSAKAISGYREQFLDDFPFPAVQGDLYARLERVDVSGVNPSAKLPKMSLHVEGILDPFATLDEIEVRGGNADDLEAKQSITIDQRIVFAPHLGFVATLPESNQRIVIRPLDCQTELRRSGTRYLAVVSNAPRQATAGSSLRYRVETLTNAPKVQFTLIGQPDGMAISAGGEITWQIPVDRLGATNCLVIVKDDAGNEVFHPIRTTIVADRQLQSVEQEPTSPAGEMRVWKDRTGSFSIRASFLRFDGTHVHLLRDDGREIVVERIKLSPEDSVRVLDLQSRK